MGGAVGTPSLWKMKCCPSLKSESLWIVQVRRLRRVGDVVLLTSEVVPTPQDEEDVHVPVIPRSVAKPFHCAAIAAEISGKHAVAGRRDVGDAVAVANDVK